MLQRIGMIILLAGLTACSEVNPIDIGPNSPMPLPGPTVSSIITTRVLPGDGTVLPLQNQNIRVSGNYTLVSTYPSLIGLLTYLSEDGVNIIPGAWMTVVFGAEGQFTNNPQAPLGYERKQTRYIINRLAVVKRVDHQLIVGEVIAEEKVPWTFNFE